MTSPAAPAEVRRAREADIATVGRILAAAFDDDPVFAWFVRQDERRGAAIEQLLRGGADRAVREHGECYLLDDASGAAVWRPPGIETYPPGDRSRLAEEICGTPERQRRFSQFIEVMSAQHRADPPHFYLGTIGVLPSVQRGGLGSVLIRGVLERCDREGIPAFLINTKERNLAFYGRHGFAAVARVELPDGGPPVWPMWREPQAEQRP